MTLTLVSAAMSAVLMGCATAPGGTGDAVPEAQDERLGTSNRLQHQRDWDLVRGRLQL